MALPRRRDGRETSTLARAARRSVVPGLRARAHVQAERTHEEIRDEAIARADRGGYPLIGLDPADVREAFSSIATLDRDEWAAAWIALGDRYAARAAADGGRDPGAASADYLRAWRLYSFGRWPLPSSPGKQPSPIGESCALLGSLTSALGSTTPRSVN